MLELYKNIKQKRKELHMSQSDLAKSMGYADKSMISRIEKGEIDLQQSKIIAFAKIFNMHPGDLMGYKIESPDRKTRDFLLSNIEKEIIEKARKLNPNGLSKLNGYADDLISSGKYENIQTNDRVI